MISYFLCFFLFQASATADEVIDRARQIAEGKDVADISSGKKTIKTEMKSGNLTITI